MIATIIIVSLALVWLLKETNYLRIRFESTEYQKIRDKVKADMGIEKESDIKNEVPYKPSEFVAMDMPSFSGSLNIVCQR